MTNSELQPRFQSPLAPLMEQFVRTKQACGYRFGEGSRLLRCFDRYLTAEGLVQCELPRVLVRQWLAKQPHESARTQQCRICLVRQFAGYLCRLGYCAYVPDRSLLAKASSGFCPRILTHTEVQQLLQAVDQLTPTARAPTPCAHSPVLPARYPLPLPLASSFSFTEREKDHARYGCFISRRVPGTLTLLLRSAS